MKRVPLTIDGHQVGWAEVEEMEAFSSAAPVVKTYHIFSEQDVPDEVKPTIRWWNENTLKGLSIED